METNSYVIRTCADQSAFTVCKTKYDTYALVLIGEQVLFAWLLSNSPHLQAPPSRTMQWASAASRGYEPHDIPLLWGTPCSNKD